MHSYFVISSVLLVLATVNIFSRADQESEVVLGLLVGALAVWTLLIACGI